MLANSVPERTTFRSQNETFEKKRETRRKESRTVKLVARRSSRIEEDQRRAYYCTLARVFVKDDACAMDHTFKRKTRRESRGNVKPLTTTALSAILFTLRTKHAPRNIKYIPDIIVRSSVHLHCMYNVVHPSRRKEQSFESSK